MKVIVITGLSGAGKSQALECLEDRGFYGIDNMPPALIKNFIDLASSAQSNVDKVALVMDMRTREAFGDIGDAVAELKAAHLDVKILFLEASNSEIIRRFSATRRVHPLTRKPATESDIEREKKALRSIRVDSDFVIDTSSMKTAKLKAELADILGDENREETFVINITSFGYKYGLPSTAEMVFDMRFIPNPYYVPTLKRSTGNNKRVQRFVMKFQESKTFVKNVDKLVNNIIPCYMREGKWNLNIAFGCTGGHHRSVAMANLFCEKFKAQGKQVTLDHRDIRKE